MINPKLRASGLLLGTFVAGAIVGGATAAFADLDVGINRRKDHSYIELLQDKLNLTGHQHGLAEEFISRYNDAVRVIWDDVSPRYEEIRSNVRNEIMGILDEEQQNVYRSMIAHSDSVRAERKRRSNDRE